LGIKQKAWCTPCPVYCCWEIALYTMNERIKRKFKIRINISHWEFYSQGWCQILRLCLLSVCLSVFPQSFKSDWFKVILHICCLIFF
jgi:hypothetical protein